MTSSKQPTEAQWILLYAALLQVVGSMLLVGDLTVAPAIELVDAYIYSTGAKLGRSMRFDPTIVPVSVIHKKYPDVVENWITNLADEPELQELLEAMITKPTN